MWRRSCLCWAKNGTLLHTARYVPQPGYVEKQTLFRISLNRLWTYTSLLLGDSMQEFKDKSYLQALLKRVLHASETVAIFCYLLWKTDIHFNRLQTSRLRNLSVDFDPFPLFMFLVFMERLFIFIVVMIDDNKKSNRHSFKF